MRLLTPIYKVLAQWALDHVSAWSHRDVSVTVGNVTVTYDGIDKTTTWEHAALPPKGVR